MPRLARKFIHTLARAYNLGSKSSGSGPLRFTTLFKTGWTANEGLNERKINGILKAFVRFGPNRSNGTPSSSSTRPLRKHKDGDIVGGDAKEISSDNRGRVMLEKLGWRSGMGLGAEGLGMKLPVFAVVKSGKSGLQ
jgi:G-patch domain/R3H domain